MNIKIGKYKLSSDARQFIISKPRISKSGKDKGEIVDVDKSYHSTLEQAINNLLKRRLLKSRATSLEELLNDLNTHREAMRRVLKEEA